MSWIDIKPKNTYSTARRYENRCLMLYEPDGSLSFESDQKNPALCSLIIVGNKELNYI